MIHPPLLGKTKIRVPVRRKINNLAERCMENVSSAAQRQHNKGADDFSKPKARIHISGEQLQVPNITENLLKVSSPPW